MYSLRMSFWIVPPSFSREMPFFSATARYIANRMAAGELMVIEVVIWPRSMPSKSTSMSAQGVDGDAAAADLARACSSSESRPIRVGMSKATESPSWPFASRYL